MKVWTTHLYGSHLNGNFHSGPILNGCLRGYLKVKSIAYYLKLVNFYLQLKRDKNITSLAQSLKKRDQIGTDQTHHHCTKKTRRVGGRGLVGHHTTTLPVIPIIDHHTTNYCIQPNTHPPHTFLSHKINWDEFFDHDTATHLLVSHQHLNLE